MTPRTVNFFNLKKGTEQRKNLPLSSYNKNPEISNIRIQKYMMIYETYSHSRLKLYGTPSVKFFVQD